MRSIIPGFWTGCWPTTKKNSEKDSRLPPDVSGKQSGTDGGYPFQNLFKLSLRQEYSRKMKAFHRNLKERYPRIYAAVINKPVLLLRKSGYLLYRRHLAFYWKERIKINMRHRERTAAGLFFNTKIFCFSWHKGCGTEIPEKLSAMYERLESAADHAGHDGGVSTMFQRKITNYPVYLSSPAVLLNFTVVRQRRPCGRSWATERCLRKPMC